MKISEARADGCPTVRGFDCVIEWMCEYACESQHAYYEYACEYAIVLSMDAVCKGWVAPAVDIAHE
jgi:hypothetical protein